MKKSPAKPMAVCRAVISWLHDLAMSKTLRSGLRMTLRVPWNVWELGMALKKPVPPHPRRVSRMI